MEEYRDMFLAEAREYLQGMTEHLLEMEKDPCDTDHLVEIFRSAHSLKGMSGTMGYEIIAGLTHKMETLLDSLRSGEAAVETKLVSLLFEAVDTVQALVDNLDNQADYRAEVQTLEKKLLAWQGVGKSKGTADHVAEEIASPITETATFPTGNDPERLEMTPEMVKNFNDYEQELLKDAVSRGEALYHLHISLREGSLLKSVRAYMVCKAIEAQGEIINAIPSLPELEEGHFDQDFTLTITGDPNSSELQHTLEGIAEIEKVELTPVVPEREVGATVASTASSPDQQVSPHTVEADAPKFSGTLVADSLSENTPPAVIEAKKPGGQAPARATEKTVRVETAKLDTLINLVGELIINRTRVMELGKQAGDELLEGSLEHLQRVTSDLQGAAMSLRMVPIKQVFDRFPRMVRDLAIGKGKEVEFVISGADTELDRSIVNQVGDPLVHLLRNAVDHGIETQAERTANNKSVVGTIKLEAHHEGSHVVVSVADDGKGIDPRTIRAKALEKGIATREELDMLDDDEAVNLVFRSGFSTSRELTDISGRGVGMDVVKSAVGRWVARWK